MTPEELEKLEQEAEKYAGIRPDPFSTKYIEFTYEEHWNNRRSNWMAGRLSAEPIIEEYEKKIVIGSNYVLTLLKAAGMAETLEQERDDALAKLEKLADAARDWRDSTEEECSHDPEWQALSRALADLDKKGERS